MQYISYALVLIIVRIQVTKPFIASVPVVAHHTIATYS